MKRHRSNRDHLKQFPRHLTRQPRDTWPTKIRTHPYLAEVWLSCHYMVQVYRTPDGVVRLSINRARNRAGQWEDNIPWLELQAIKGAVGYAHRQAVEIFPPAADVVNVANFRHLWILPEPVPVSLAGSPAADVPGAPPTSSAATHPATP